MHNQNPEYAFGLSITVKNYGRILKFDNESQSLEALFSWTKTVGQFCGTVPNPHPFVCMLPVSCAKV